MKIKQVRNATLLIDFGGVTFLVDPLLAKKEAYTGFEGTLNSHLRWPLTDLRTPIEEILDVRAVIVTHTHGDHWDGAAVELLPKHLTIFTQHVEDAELIRSQGFTNVRVLEGTEVFGGVSITKTAGRHGTEQVLAARDRGEVCGVVLEHPDEQTVYVAGDTVWSDCVRSSLETYRPDVVVLNAGDAQVPEGSLIMGADDVLKVYEAAPWATVIASHMETVNHSALTRAELRAFAHQTGMVERVLIPEDNEAYGFPRRSETRDADSNKKVVAAFYDAINREDFDNLGVYCHDDFVFYPQIDTPFVGVEGFVASEKKNFAAYDNWRMPVERLIAEGDQVAAYLVFEGTHAREFNGIKPTGQKVRLSLLIILTMKDGLIIEKRAHFDMHDSLAQMARSSA